MFKRQSKPTNSESSQTEARLLEAAGEVFAEFGYRAATVRQICEKAGANVAAVNYYFGDKEQLYLAVLHSVPDAHSEKYPSNGRLRAASAPGDRLRVYIESLLHRVFDPGRPGWHAKIIARELAEPTRALDSLLEEIARPLHRELAGIVRELLGPAAREEDVRFCALSIMGQCVYYHHARAVLARLYPEHKSGAENVSRLVNHITEFSLAGLRQFAQQRQRNELSRNHPE
jgi:TetR/AcrR family transcriptional regulator, regulator of cefoperazone and chloramphenicol sensitivity